MTTVDREFQELLDEASAVYGEPLDGELEDAEALKGSYNVGRKVDGSLYWQPIEEHTVEIGDDEDLMCYHLSRLMNAKVLENAGLDVVDAEITINEYQGDEKPFLRTDYRGDLAIGSDEVRESFGRMGNSPINQGAMGWETSDPWNDAVVEVDKLLEEADPSRLKREGKIVYAGHDLNGLNRHPDNWGINPVAGNYVLLDLGEVPDTVNFPPESPYDTGHEMWEETGIRDKAQELMP